jgi:hypothetical protein
MIQMPQDNVWWPIAEIIGFRLWSSNMLCARLVHMTPRLGAQKTLASLGITSGVRFVMVEDDPGSRRTSLAPPHQNPFAMLASNTAMVRMLSRSKLIAVNVCFSMTLAWSYDPKLTPLAFYRMPVQGIIAPKKHQMMTTSIFQTSLKAMEIAITTARITQATIIRMISTQRSVTEPVLLSHPLPLLSGFSEMSEISSDDATLCSGVC